MYVKKETQNPKRLSVNREQLYHRAREEEKKRESIIIQVKALIKYCYIKQSEREKKTRDRTKVYSYLFVFHLGVVSNSHPIGPSFISSISTKQRLYYNNLGTRLDCSANGSPLPVLTWLRTNGSDDRPSTIVEPSEFMWEILSCSISSSLQLLAIDHSASISCELLGGKLQSIFIHLFAIERNGNSFLIIIRHLSNKLINIDERLTKKKRKNFALSLIGDWTWWSFSFVFFSDVYENGSLFIRPFQNYFKSIHAGTYLCQAENAAGSIQTTPIQLKPRECLRWERISSLWNYFLSS